MNGRNLAEAMAVRRPNIRIVFVSGYTDQTVNRAGLIRPGRTFVQKPFGGGKLLGAVREVLAAEVLDLP